MTFQNQFSSNLLEEKEEDESGWEKQQEHYGMHFSSVFRIFTFQHLQLHQSWIALNCYPYFLPFITFPSLAWSKNVIKVFLYSIQPCKKSLSDKNCSTLRIQGTKEKFHYAAMIALSVRNSEKN